MSMKWIDAKRFLREEGEKHGLMGELSTMIKAMLCMFTIIGFPFGIYLLTGIRGSRTEAYLKKNIYDVEDTNSEIKIIRTEFDKYGILWWKNPDYCKVLEQAVYDEVIRCESELFIIKQNGKYGIHRNGKLQTPIQYDYMKYLGNDKFSISPNSNSYINSHGERL